MEVHRRRNGSDGPDAMMRTRNVPLRGIVPIYRGATRQPLFFPGEVVPLDPAVPVAPVIIEPIP